MATAESTVDDVKALLVELLGIADRAEGMDASTELLGNLPELDSMAVVEVISALEERFGIAVDDTEIGADTFETLGSLAAFVEAHRPA
ncbi:MAG TPA: acyl carrier protein [Kineosporiaceae bacterium]|nr:acyl carrier protein [Kineosporiaceae bacterium]